MKKRHILVVVGVTCTALTAPAGPAAAISPKARLNTFTLDGTDTQGQNGFCPFPVLVNDVDNSQTTQTLLPDGTQVLKIAGAHFITMTNAGTGPGSGKSIRFNANGPGTVAIAPDGSFTIDAAGPNLLWTTVANSATGVPRIAYTNGHLQVSVAASGQTTSYRLAGSSTDVCQSLA